MIRALRLVATPILALVLALALPGCQFGARRQLDECRRLSQTLRSQNDQLKDQMLAYRNQNQDFSERAVDDARRLSQQDEAIERLERSVQAYQGERDELQTAFSELRDSLPATIRAASSPSGTRVQAARDPDDAPKPREFKVPSRARAETDVDEPEDRRTGWAPAAGEPASDPGPTRAAP
ncbi:MAG: hypothetical protein P4L85_13505 [Paludisphaera borealis]|uniref:hypothetical protein n=1 Tax=Paludisphaera borealis TaxID=1387353 RepID=UPI0028480C46|nr:hypothetical protein [Paludisphaera borealis]MDR3620361.1 hypothetical protein [Paludisphaera borealis]